MRSKILTLAVVIVLCTVPVAASALTLSELVELFISLGIIAPEKAGAAREAVDNATVGSTVGTTNTTVGVESNTTVNSSLSCVGIARNLSIGSRGDDVVRLQTFLRGTGDFTYPEITGYYGSVTAQAVERFQARKGIVSSGTPETSGYGAVGPRTRIVLADCTGVSNQPPNSPNSSGDVGGLLYVTPTSGAAPLTVTAEATVNTTNACGAQTYSLDFGDNTQAAHIAVPANRCIQLKQSVSHTYANAGTYTMRLSAGDQFSTVTIVVTGNTTTSSATLSASPASGTAPLSVQLSGTIQSCVANASYTLNFGDGASSPVSCGSYSLSHTYTSVGTYSATLRTDGGSEASSSAVELARTSISVSQANVQDPTLSITSISPTSVKRGETLSVSWSAQNAPAGARIRLEVYPASVSITNGNNDQGLASGTSELATSGTYTWTVPADNGAMLADAGHSGYNLTPGQYKIVAKLYSGGACWGFCEPSSSSRTVHKTAESSAFTITEPTSTEPTSNANLPFTIQPGADGDPYNVKVIFNTSTPCTAYTLSWGDGTSSVSGGSSGGVCAQVIDTKTFSHVYAAGGTYTVTLTRGNSTDSATVVISAY